MNHRLQSFLVALLLISAAVISSATAAPATEESLQALDATVTQNSMISLIVAHVVLVAIGFIAGQQR